MTKYFPSSVVFGRSSRLDVPEEMYVSKNGVHSTGGGVIRILHRE